MKKVFTAPALRAETRLERLTLGGTACISRCEILD